MAGGWEVGVRGGGGGEVGVRNSPPVPGEEHDEPSRNRATTGALC